MIRNPFIGHKPVPLPPPPAPERTPFYVGAPTIPVDPRDVEQRRRDRERRIRVEIAGEAYAAKLMETTDAAEMRRAYEEFLAAT